MFSVDEIQTIDQQYFNVKNTGCYQITLQSKNTRHIWNIRSQVLTLERGRSLVVYHKHKANQPYRIFSCILFLCWFDDIHNDLGVGSIYQNSVSIISLIYSALTYVNSNFFLVIIFLVN